MGKTIDLPDPLDAASPLNGASLDGDSGGGTSSADADDILSQLAGDEIDRLLAEADVEKGPGESPVPGELTTDLALAPTKGPVETSISDETDASDEELSVEPGVLDAVLDNASSNPAASSPFAIAADAPPIDATALSTAAQVNSANALVALPDASQMAVAFSAPVEDAAATSIDTTRGLPSEEDWPYDERPLPIFLRPLAWLNAPFDALPDTAREVLGKVAILTIFNAIAVLVYVLVFRR